MGRPSLATQSWLRRAAPHAPDPSERHAHLVDSATTYPRPKSPQAMAALFDLELEFLRRVAAAPLDQHALFDPDAWPGRSKWG